MKTEIIPVIHMLNTNQVLTNVRCVINCGLRKVFIVNHNVSDESLIETALYVKELYPEMWVGINPLGSLASKSVKLNLELDGLWCDQTLTQEQYDTKVFKGTIFGGLAFKYQPQSKNLKLASELATTSTDVATTSGIGTGKEANISKILEIRNYLGKHPMAIASGVNKDNIGLYKSIVNYLLVASSITSSSEIIQEDKLRELINIIKDTT